MVEPAVASSHSPRSSSKNVLSRWSFFIYVIIVLTWPQGEKFYAPWYPVIVKVQRGRENPHYGQFSSYNLALDLVIVRVQRGRYFMTCYNLIGIYFLFQLRSACFSSGLRSQEIFGQCSKAAKSYRQVVQFEISSSHVCLVPFAYHPRLPVVLIFANTRAPSTS